MTAGTIDDGRGRRLHLHGSGRATPRASTSAPSICPARGRRRAYDERAQPVGFSLMAIGFIGFVLSFGRGGTRAATELAAAQAALGQGRRPRERGDELSPRLSCRQFRRRRQACGAGPAGRISEAQGQALPRHRHPCRRRASTTFPAEEAQKTGEWRGGIGAAARGTPARGGGRCSRPIWMRWRRPIPTAGSRAIPARR